MGAKEKTQSEINKLRVARWVELRKDFDHTQDDVASVLGLSHGAVAKRENYTTPIKEEDIEILLRYFNGLIDKEVVPKSNNISPSTEHEAEVIAQYTKLCESMHPASVAYKTGEETRIEARHYRVEWLSGKDSFKTNLDYAIALERQINSAASKRQGAMEQVLYDAMTRAGFTHSHFMLEEPESGCTVPFPANAQDHLIEQIQDYAAMLVTNYYWTAMRYSREVELAKLRGDEDAEQEFTEKLKKLEGL